LSNYLTKSELRERTGYAQRPAQRAALLRLGIPFDVDGRGRILVLREQVFGKPKRIAHSPNWDAIKAA
jgi:hypothetical protein